MIVRPSIAFGPEDSFFNRFAAIARVSPALPLIGGGHTRFQPVYSGDIVVVDGSNIKEAQKKFFQSIPLFAIFSPL